MRLFLFLISMILLAGCSSDPVIIPDHTSDNVVMMALKDKIAEPGAQTESYGWLFWYGPVAVIALMWGVRTFVLKPVNCIEAEPGTPAKEVPVIQEDKPQA